jgi:cold shock CspA family protein
MAGSQESFNKRDKEKKRLKKRQDKLNKLASRKANPQGGSMIAYVDENGRITDTPPDPSSRKKIDADSIQLGVPKRDTEEVNPIRKGRVEFFNQSKGFGFIKELETQEKYFVHANSLTDVIVENDTVTFEVERTFKGLNAVRVKKV